MRKITIYQEGEPIQLLDDSSSNIQQDSKELSKLLHSNNVSVLITTSAALIIRPSKINSILVEELSSDEIEERESLLVDKIEDFELEDSESVVADKQEDIITDVE
jgi:hypothetical protein